MSSKTALRYRAFQPARCANAFAALAPRIPPNAQTDRRTGSGHQQSLEGVEENGELDSINASNNCIKTVSGVAHLKRLNTLQLAHNRLATPEDVARSLVVLSHADLDWLTGNVLNIDGGENICE